VELDALSAVELVRAVAQVFVEVPEDLTGIDPQQARRLLDAASAITATTAPEPL
jgi:hypothetical protein